MSTFAQLLQNAVNTLSPTIGESASFEARILLCHAFDISNEKLLVQLHDEADSLKIPIFNTLVQKRSTHIPLQYLLGSWEFMGLPFYVAKNVLIPRADSETLVLCALELFDKKKQLSVLDMCCGSGCLGLSFKKLAEKNGACVSLTLADISPDALNLSKRNAALLSVQADIIHTNLFDSITGSFDLILCNPPYIRTKDLQTLDAEVLHEPMLALSGGEDGLDIYRRIKDEYLPHLNDGGVLILEIGYDMADDVKAIFGGYVLRDMCQNDRAVVVHKQ